MVKDPKMQETRLGGKKNKKLLNKLKVCETKC